MKNGLTVHLLLFLSVAVSCEKELTPVVENEGVPLLTKEIFSDELYNEFTYNEQNLLKERKSKWFYTLYHYDASNRVARSDLYEDPGIYSSNRETAEAAWNRTDWVSPENSEITARGMYNYHNSKIVAVTVTHATSNITYITYFQYDDSHRVEMQFLNLNNVPSDYIHYMYDGKGNVIQEEHYFESNGVSVLLSKKTFEYDNNHNPFKIFKQLLTPGIYTNENNIIRETLTLMQETQGIDSVQVTISDYEYNEQGYPVTKNGIIRYEYK